MECFPSSPVHVFHEGNQTCEMVVEANRSIEFFMLCHVDKPILDGSMKMSIDALEGFLRQAWSFAIDK